MSAENRAVKYISQARKVGQRWFQDKSKHCDWQNGESLKTANRVKSIKEATRVQGSVRRIDFYSPPSQRFLSGRHIASKRLQIQWTGLSFREPMPGENARTHAP